MESLLILTEAGDNIGFGHYTRCSAIAAAAAENATVKVLLDIKGGQDLPMEHGEVFDWRTNLPVVLEMAARYDVVLIDSYLATAEEFSQLTSAFKLCAVIDDYQRMVYPVHLVINPNVHGNALDTSGQTAEWVGGSNYIILREAFRKKVKGALRPSEQINKVTITVGGSDYRDLLAPLTNWMVAQDLRVIVLAGNEDRAEKVMELYRGEFSMFGEAHVEAFGLVDAAGMYAAFEWADVVITAAGQTTHELASMGKATIAISIDHDQENNINFYTQAGFFLEALQWNATNLKAGILRQLAKFQSTNVQRTTGAAGKKAVDGEGVNRIVALLKSRVPNEA